MLPLCTKFELVFLFSMMERPWQYHWRLYIWNWWWWLWHHLCWKWQFWLYYHSWWWQWNHNWNWDQWNAELSISLCNCLLQTLILIRESQILARFQLTIKWESQHLNKWIIYFVANILVYLHNIVCLQWRTKNRNKNYETVGN